MIQTTLTGRLGADAELKTVGDNKQVLEFTVASDIGFGEHKKTLWVKCSKWGEKTAVLPFLKKGVQVLIVGEPSIHAYTNKESQVVGQMQIRVEKLELLSKASEGSAAPSAYSAPATAVEPLNDDLPF